MVQVLASAHHRIEIANLFMMLGVQCDAVPVKNAGAKSLKTEYEADFQADCEVNF
jgi:hypothetical protein